MKYRMLLFLVFCNTLLYSISLEEIATNADGELQQDIADYYGILELSPLNINTASKWDLTKLVVLSEVEIKRIINYRFVKKIASYRQLVQIGVKRETVEFLKPYISFKQDKDWNFNYISRYLWQEEINYLEADFYNKIFYESENYEICLLQQKDRKEPRFVDFKSFYIMYKSENLLRQIVLGKYYLTFGQGLLLSNKLGMKRGFNPTSNFQKKNRILGYKSSFEAWSFKGSAAKLSYGTFSFIPFYSNNKLDVNTENGEILSFDESGIHLSEVNEIVKEVNAGIISEFRLGLYNMGLLLMSDNFSKPVKDNRYGSSFNSTSLSLIRDGEKIDIFTEIGFLKNDKAYVAGFKNHLGPLVQSFVYRNFDDNFPTWHGNPLSVQGSNFSNEEGFMYNLKLRFTKSFRFYFYFDTWKHVKSRYFEDMPTAGSEYGIRPLIRFGSNKILITIKNKYYDKYKNISNITQIVNLNKNLYRIDYVQDINELLRFKSRLEYIEEKVHEMNYIRSGLLTYQQLKFKINVLQVILRITNFDSALNHYSYENSISTKMETAVYSGDNTAVFFLVKFNLFRRYFIQFKYSKELGERAAFYSLLKLNF